MNFVLVLSVRISKKRRIKFENFSYSVSLLSDDSWRNVVGNSKFCILLVFITNRNLRLKL